jgi:hypothetical protein
LRRAKIFRSLKAMELHFTPEQEAHLRKSPLQKAQTPRV